MFSKTKVNLIIDPDVIETEITIRAKILTSELQRVLNTLTVQGDDIILGFKEDEVYLLNPLDLIRVYTEGKYVFAETMTDVYRLKLRIYELEEILNQKQFIRISQSEIINIRLVDKIDISYRSTLEITLKNGKVTFCSRRYVTKIKNILGI